MRTYKYIALAALTVSLAACSQDEDLASVAQNDPNAVTIHATVGILPQTRVTYGDEGSTTFGEGDQIRVINSTRSGKNKSDAVYTYEGGEWTPAETDKYVVWDGTDTNTFYGIYPSTASYDTFTLPTEQQDGVHNADWMTATYSGEKEGNGIVNFQLRHLLSKVTVNMRFATQYDGTPEISDVQFPISATELQATYQDNETVQIEATTTSKVNVLPHKNSMSYTAILPPTQYASDKPFINLTVNGTDYLTALVGDNSTLTNGLQPGKHYTFTLKVGKDKVSIDKVSVEDWETDDINGGEATEIYNNINATAMNTETLQNAVTRALQNGETNIKVTMAEKPEAEMFIAIRSALVETEGVADGSIHLTLAGCTEIPNYVGGPPEEYNQMGVFGEKLYLQLNTDEYVTQLASVTLPDVVKIGDDSFYYASNLTKVSAPKATSVGGNAFEGSGLEKVELPLVEKVGELAFNICKSLEEISLPSATTVELSAFHSCSNLRKVNLPRVTTIDCYAFHSCSKLAEITFGSLVSVNRQLYGIFYNSAEMSNITLTLSADQKVMTKNENNYWTVGEELYSESDDCKNKTFIGYTFNEIKFAE